MGTGSAGQVSPSRWTSYDDATLTDDQLLEAIARDPEGGTREFFDRYGNQLLGRIRKHARERRQGESNADDIFQEAVLRLLDPDVRIEIRARGGQILPFLSRWAYWRLDDLAKAGAREARHLMEAANPDLSSTHSKAAALVGDLVHKLSPRDRMILTWRSGDRLTNGEIAKRLEISEGAAKKAAHDARRRLRELLEDEGIRFD